MATVTMLWRENSTTICNTTWGFLPNPSHAVRRMRGVISSTGSCQVRCVSLGAATILCIVTPHDRESLEAWPYARHERDILAREDKKY
jgi:hypothetical protein